VTGLDVFRVTRCVCMRMSFERLLPLARREGWDLPALVAQTGCGDQCGMCRPYLARMLATGETTFDLLPLAAGEE
jgi:bacterioferritin-associated ferredoxin